MKFSRDNICEIHSVHVVDAETPEEAAELFKKQMYEACDKNFNNGKVFPEYIDINAVDYIPELWDPKLTFFSRETYEEYDSSGKPIPKEYEEIGEDDIEKQATDGFIWGIKSYTDLTPHDANNFTMNDVDIVYRDGNYLLGIEEFYLFDKENDRIEYLEKIAKKVREFVLTKGYSQEDVDNLNDCTSFRDYFPSAVMADIPDFRSSTLIDLYKKYKLFTVAYKAVVKACGRI